MNFLHHKAWHDGKPKMIQNKLFDCGRGSYLHFRAMNQARDMTLAVGHRELLITVNDMVANPI